MLRTTAQLIAAALALVCGLLGACASAGPVRAATTATVTTTPISQAIPSGFLGISTLPRFLETYAGSNPAQVDPAFPQLLGDIAPGQSAVLRLGGEGADQSWYPVAGVRKPPGVSYTLTKQWMQTARTVAQDMNGKLLLDLNLEADSTAVTVGEADAMVNQVGRSHIAALEIGNEPELYTHFAWYHTKAGAPVFGRVKATWTPAAYRSQYRTIAARMPTGVTIAGPASGLGTWLEQLPSFISQEPKAGLITMHAYPLKHCAASHIVTIANVLSQAASQGFIDEVAPYVRDAQQAGRPIRIDETNTITCGGTAHVSNSFATALWALDTYFGLARLGIAGLNVNMVPGSINSILNPVTTKQGEVIQVQPEYYGMMLFADAAPPGSRMMQVDQTHADPDVSTWATRQTGGETHVVIVDKHTSAGATETLRVPGAAGPATVQTLTAPSLAATGGVTLNGQTFGAGTSTGVLTGTPDPSTISPVAGGYTVTVRAGSAVMLSFAAPPATQLLTALASGSPLRQPW